MKDFIGRRVQEQGSYTGKKTGWLVHGYFPLEDGRGLLGRLTNWC